MNQSTYNYNALKSFIRGIANDYTAYQGDTRSRRNQSFRDWLLDLIFNATYQKPTTPKPYAGKVYSFDYEPPVSMVAEDSAPYGAKKED